MQDSTEGVPEKGHDQYKPPAGVSGFFVVVVVVEPPGNANCCIHRRSVNGKVYGEWCIREDIGKPLTLLFVEIILI